MNIDELIRGNHLKGVVRDNKRKPKERDHNSEFTVTIYDPYSNKRVGEVYERHMWLVENVGRRNYTVYKKQTADKLYHEFVFMNKNHAMLFKLTWGGQ